MIIYQRSAGARFPFGIQVIFQTRITRITRILKAALCLLHLIRMEKRDPRNPRNPRLKNAAQRSLQTPRSSALSRVVRVPIHR